MNTLPLLDTHINPMFEGMSLIELKIMERDLTDRINRHIDRIEQERDHGKCLQLDRETLAMCREARLIDAELEARQAGGEMGRAA